MRNINTLLYRTILLFVVIISAWPLIVASADFPPAGDSGRGAILWAENCNRCHNVRGPNDLRDDQWITTLFHMRVRAGLTGQATRDIITYMQASNRKTVTNTKTTAAKVPSKDKSANAQSGEAIYAQTCIACHAADGKGGLPGVPDFTAKDSRLNKQDAELIRNITNGFQSPGSPMAMPPKGGNPDLNSDEVTNVLQYLRETFSK